MTGGAPPRRLTTPDGVELALHRLRAHRDGRPALLLVHGAFTNHRFWLHSSDGTSAGGAAGLCWLARVAAAAPIRGIVTLGTPGPRRVGPVRRALAATTMAVSRLLGRFPARALRFGNEDEAAEIIAEWMEWNVRGRWLGMDGFDYFAGLAALSTPYLGVAGGADWIFAPPKACRQVVERVGAGQKMLAIAPGLSHRGLVLSEHARISCWPQVVAWSKETL